MAQPEAKKGSGLPGVYLTSTTLTGFAPLSHPVYTIILFAKTFSEIYGLLGQIVFIFNKLRFTVQIVLWRLS